MPPMMVDGVVLLVRSIGPVLVKLAGPVMVKLALLRVAPATVRSSPISPAVDSLFVAPDALPALLHPLRAAAPHAARALAKNTTFEDRIICFASIAAGPYMLKRALFARSRQQDRGGTATNGR